MYCKSSVGAGVPPISEEKEVGPIDRSLDSFRLCIRHEQGRSRSKLAARAVLLVRLEEAEERKRTPLEFRSSDRLRKVSRMELCIGRENRPSTGTCHSSYTCLTVGSNWTEEIKGIRKLTRACKPTWRTLQRSAAAFASNTARIGSRPIREDSTQTVQYSERY